MTRCVGSTHSEGQGSRRKDDSARASPASTSGFRTHRNAGMDVTLPRLLLQNCERHPGRVWMRKKEKGIWNEYTWQECHDHVKHFSLGLVSLGLTRDAKIAILGDNAPQWFWAELAAQAAGAAVTGVFSSSSPPEVRYLLELCDTTFVVVQDQEQVDKVLSIIRELPLVKKVIYWDGKGMRGYDHKALLSFDEVEAIGRDYAHDHPHFFEESVGRGTGQELALLVCTSGTTGMPKAAMITHEGLYSSMAVSTSVYDVYDSDEWVSYILPGWMGEQCFGLLSSLVYGFKMNFPESLSTVSEDLREIGPQIVFYPSRLWEALASSVQNSMIESSWIDRLLYRVCMPIGYHAADARFKGTKLGPLRGMLCSACGLVLFNPIKDRYGLLKLRIGFTGGAALGPDVFRLISALGVDLRQTFGSSEIGISQHTPGDVKVDSVGRVNPETVVRVADDGQILVRGKATLLGYYKNPEATKKAFAGGWYNTGDTGFLDDEGHLYYLDRLEYMRELADGTRYAPQYLESRLKFSPFIQDVFVLGDTTRQSVSVIVNINSDNVGNWAEKRRVSYTTYADLSQRPEVCELVRGEIKNVNRSLPDGLQVKKFVIMPKPFDPDEAELTRTMKLRRGFLEERYRAIVDAVYGQEEEFAMEVPVAYRDGRTAIVSTKVRVVRV